MERKKYYLLGHIEVTHWGGQHGWKEIEIITDEKGLDEIRKNPLQDYVEFGVQSVDYAIFDIYVDVIHEDGNAIYTTSYKKPIETIEAGKSVLSEEEAIYMENHFREDIVTINY